MTTSTVLWANNAKTTLATSITNIQTTVTLASSTGALFPSPAAGQYFPLTLQSASNATILEICYCTSRSGDVLTVTRGQEGTSALAFNAGDNADNLVTAGTLAAFGQIAGANTWTGTNVFDQLVQGGAGFLSTAWDTGGFSLRATYGNYGVGLRNDGASAYWVQTASGNQNGSYSTLRPFAWSLSTGYVSIDATGAGAGFGGAIAVAGSATIAGALSAATVTSAGAISASSGNINSNAGRVRAALGALGSGDNAACAILGDWTNTWAGTNQGYTVNPRGVYDQTFNAAITTVAGFATVNVNLPTAFPTLILDAVACFDGNLPPLNASISVQPVSGSRSQIALTANSASAGLDLGVTIRTRGY